MTTQLQPHYDMSRTVALVGLFLLAAGLVTVALAVAFDKGPHSPPRYASIAGVLSASLGLFVGLGFWVQHLRVKRALTEMKAGAVLGDWHAKSPSGKVLHVQVGPKLAIVGGKILRYAVHLQTVTKVAYAPGSDVLVVHATIDAGYGPGAFEVRLPTGPRPRETVACARSLADHHQVAFAENRPP